MASLSQTLSGAGAVNNNGVFTFNWNEPIIKQPVVLCCTTAQIV